jgi:hypothetical protein
MTSWYPIRLSSNIPSEAIKFTTVSTGAGLATGWTVRGSNPGGGVIFPVPVQTGPIAHPASYKMGTGSIPGVKRPGRDVDHPPHLEPRLKKE